MQRFTKLFLFLLLVFALTACTADPDPTPTILPTQIVDPTLEPTTEPEPTDSPTEEPTSTTEATAEATAEPTAETTPEPTGEPTEEPPTTNTVGLMLVAEGFSAPVALVPAPDDSGRLFVVDQTGQVRLIAADGQVMEEPFLDIQDRMVSLEPGYDERGLLGMAFHPDFAENGRFFVYYSAPLRSEAPSDWDHTSHLSEFAVSTDNPDMADADSEQIILQVDQPQGNHNAGSITFGPDGYLYVPLGDGGAADDVALGHVDDWYEENEGGNGQDLAQNLLGSILRLDVDNVAEGELYAIPQDNPFADQAGAELVWAIGFRNPYRMAFDMGGDQALYVGDAGQNLWEEVSIVESGGNYGWNVKEGTHCFSTANPNESLDQCPEMDADGRPLIDPILEYQNGNAGGLGLVVIGGNVYRGSAMPEWDGRYIFGDWSTGFGQPDGTLFIATASAAEGELWTMEELMVAGNDNGRLNEYLLSFGQDNDGEIYILTSETSGPTGSTGKVYRLVPPDM